jgi:hypothetical protein
MSSNLGGQIAPEREWQSRLEDLKTSVIAERGGGDFINKTQPVHFSSTQHQLAVRTQDR